MLTLAMSQRAFTEHCSCLVSVGRMSLRAFALVVTDINSLCVAGHVSVVAQCMRICAVAGLCCTPLAAYRENKYRDNVSEKTANSKFRSAKQLLYNFALLSMRQELCVKAGCSKLCRL